MSQPPTYSPPPEPYEEESGGLLAGLLDSVLAFFGNALAWVRGNIVIAVAGIVVLVLILAAVVFLLRGRSKGDEVGEATPIPFTVEPQPELAEELPAPEVATSEEEEVAPLPQPTEEVFLEETEEPAPALVEEPTPEPIEEPAPQPSTCPSTHTVQPGENLFRIGLRYGISHQQLAAANGIANPSRVQAGQVLNIPYCGSAGAGGQVHIVQSGENLFRIALRYGTTWEQLATYNNLADPRLIYPGDAIRIPD